MKTIDIIGSESSNALNRANQLYEIYVSRSRAVIMLSPEGSKEWYPSTTEPIPHFDVVIKHSYAECPLIETHKSE